MQLPGRDPSALPPRPGGGQFDHVPLGVHIRWFTARKKKAQAQAQASGHVQQVHWRWRDELHAHYIPLLHSHDVQSVWDGIQDDMTSEEAVARFATSLQVAVSKLHTQCGRVIVHGGGRKNTSQPQPNGWYNADCKTARDRIRHMACVFGERSHEAHEARREYRAVTARAKHAFQARAADELVAKVYSSPKGFWGHWRDTSIGTVDACGGMDAVHKYFRDLFAANKAGNYFGGSLESHCHEHASLFPTADSAAVQAAQWLNKPFTEHEIQHAVKNLAHGKAAGVDGVVAEFIRHASVPRVLEDGREVMWCVMGPVLTKLFNCVLKGGYPAQWGVSALVPVPKPRGRPDVLDDYRGIVVGPALSKLYAMLLLARMDEWAETRGLRAAGQAGFRSGRGTLDNSFVLRHLVDSAALKEQPLYCAFIDFSKAYDRVDRQLLWRCLQGMGLAGPALDTLQQMYEHVWLQVRAGGSLGEPFRSDVGVKQGCPLSPLLFGIYIDRLERFLADKCPGAGARLAGQVLRCLLYADDVVLIAESPAQLQSMLSCLQTFCEASSMFVNRKKSEVVMFNSRFLPVTARTPAFIYDGEPLATTDAYKYLGLVYKDGRPARAAVGDTITKARRVMMDMFGRCAHLGLHNLDTMGHLFDALVKPVLSFGCEIWGPDWVSGKRVCDRGDFASGDAEKEVHLPFMRRAMGVSSTTAVVAMMNELGREPLMFHWLRMAAQLWNKALGRHSADYLRAALIENINLACARGIKASQRKTLWASHFIDCMESLGIPWCNEAGAPAQICVPNLTTAMKQRWLQFESSDIDRAVSTRPDWLKAPSAVRAAPESFSRGFKKFTYQRWFATKYIKRRSFAFHLQRKEHIRTVMQFRLGSFNWLGIQSGRCAARGKRRLARRERTCPLCKTVEDEAHILQCPLYADIWQHAALFVVPEGGWTDSSIHAAFNYSTRQDCTVFAECLVQCKKRKEALLCPGCEVAR